MPIDKEKLAIRLCILFIFIFWSVQWFRFGRAWERDLAIEAGAAKYVPVGNHGDTKFVYINLAAQEGLLCPTNPFWSRLP